MVDAYLLNVHYYFTQLCPIAAGSHQGLKVTYTYQERSFKKPGRDDATVPQVGMIKGYAAGNRHRGYSAYRGTADV